MPSVHQWNGHTLPTYDEMPKLPGTVQGSSWGLWEQLLQLKEPDQLGSLNLLCPEVVRAAKQEIRQGISVAINWNMRYCSHPQSNRQHPSHRIFPLSEAGQDWIGHDDEVSFNTQSGSQWDGFREYLRRSSYPADDKGHWAHQPSGRYYNGVSHAHITSTDTPQRNGIDGEYLRPRRLKCFLGLTYRSVDKTWRHRWSGDLARLRFLG